MHKQIIMLVIIFLFSANSAADIYVWTDDNGIKHFSNVPPPEDTAAVKIINEEKLDETADRSSEAVQQQASKVETIRVAEQPGTSKQPDNPAADQKKAEALIQKERNRLENKLAQLNSELEAAETARGRGSSYDYEDWTKKIEGIKTAVKRETERSEIRVQQIRKKYDVR